MKKLCVGLAMFALVACTSTKGVAISEERLAELKKNRATVQEVVAQFGQPKGSQLLPNGDRVLMYSLEKVSVDPKAAIPFVGLFANDSGFSNSFTSLTFGADGTLQTYSTQNMNYGGGSPTYSPGMK